MASFSLANLLKIGVKATSLVIVGPTPKFRTKYRTNLFYPEVGAPTGATRVHWTLG